MTEEKEVATESNGQEKTEAPNNPELEAAIIRQVEYYFGESLKNCNVSYT